MTLLNTNLISIGKLSTAFNLTAEESMAIFDSLPAGIESALIRFFIKGDRMEGANNEICKMSRETLNWIQQERVPEIINTDAKAYIAGSFVNFAAIESEKQQTPEFINKLQLLLNGSQDVDGLTADFLEMPLVYLSRVNKSDAVLMLKQKGFPFVKDVKGLTKEIYQEIIQANTGTASQPPQEYTAPEHEGDLATTSAPDSKRDEWSKYIQRQINKLPSDKKIKFDSASIDGKQVLVLRTWLEEDNFNQAYFSVYNKKAYSGAGKSACIQAYEKLIDAGIEMPFPIGFITGQNKRTDLR